MPRKNRQDPYKDVLFKTVLEGEESFNRFRALNTLTNSGRIEYVIKRKDGTTRVVSKQAFGSQYDTYNVYNKNPEWFLNDYLQELGKEKDIYPTFYIDAVYDLWANPIKNRLYPTWDKVYSVLDKPNASLEEIENAEVLFNTSGRVPQYPIVSGNQYNKRWSHSDIPQENFSLYQGEGDYNFIVQYNKAIVDAYNKSLSDEENSIKLLFSDKKQVLKRQTAFTHYKKTIEQMQNDFLKEFKSLSEKVGKQSDEIKQHKDELFSFQESESNTIAQLNEALMNNTTENIKLSEDVSKLGRSFTQLRQEHSAFQSDVSKVYDVSARLDSLRQSFSTQQKNVSKLAKEQNASNIRYAKEQADIRAGIKQTNAVVAQTSKKADALKAEAGKLQEKVAGIAKQQEGILQDLNVSREGLAKADDAFKTFHKETIRKYNALQKQSDALSRQLEDKNKGFQQATEELKLAQDKQNADVAKLKQSASEHQQRTEQRMKEINKFVELNRSTLEKQGVDLQNLREMFKKDTEALKIEIGGQFKTVFDEKANTDRIIKKQNKQTTTFKQLRRPMPDKARAFRLLRRGRYALLEDVI